MRRGTTSLDPNTPVLVGAGIVGQREEDPLLAVEPMALMISATVAAAEDAGAPELLHQIDRILVPVGRWRYANPGRMVGDAVGSPDAATVSALPGVSQQTILSDAASAIAAGEITTALVVGGEAGYRLLRARIEGVELVDTDTSLDDPADVVLKPNDKVLPDHERDSGLGVMAAGYYALIDSAYRHESGQDVATRRDEMAARYHRFSQTAAANPYGWEPEPVDADTVRDARMMAFPYTKHHVSNWNVDQASALLLTSVAEAERLGVARDKWIFPHAFAESNHMVDVSARADLHRCVGAELAARAVLDATECSVEELDFAELYTCFPVAVDIFGDALGMPDAMVRSFVGAMPFAGGPFNNYVLHSTAQLARHLRSFPGGRGLVTTVSGFLTKQGFAIWGAEPNPRGYQFTDVTAQTAAASVEREVDPTYEGPAVVVAYTVMHSRTGPEQGVVLVDLADGRRSIGSTDDADLMAAMQRDEFCGVAVTMQAGRFRLP